MGPEIAAVIQSRGVAAKQGFLMYYSKGDAIGTKVSVRYRRSGRLSEVVVTRGSTVYVLLKHIMVNTSTRQLYRDKGSELTSHTYLPPTYSSQDF